MPAAIADSTVPPLPGCAEPAMIVSATAPETAITAPTERSMPRVAMTTVMPSATSISGALLRRMSMSGAVELAVAHGDPDELRAGDRVDRDQGDAAQATGQNSR